MHAPPPCVTVPNLVALRQTVSSHAGGPKIGDGGRGARTLGMWALAKYVLRSARKKVDPSLTVKVIGTVTDRSADFLLVIRSNHMGLSRTVSEMDRDFCQKSQIFPPPL